MLFEVHFVLPDVIEGLEFMTKGAIEMFWLWSLVQDKYLNYRLCHHKVDFFPISSYWLMLIIKFYCTMDVYSKLAQSL